MPNTAAEIKAALGSRRKTQDVEVAGVVFRLRSLSAGDAVRFQGEIKKIQTDGGNEDALMFALLARSWVDEAGLPLFPPNAKGEHEEGIEFAESLDPSDCADLVKEALILNGLNKSAVDDAAGNSSASRRGSTPTGSPENSDGLTSI